MKRFGLGFKIMIFTFLLLVVTAGMLIYFSYRTAYSDLEEAIGQRLEAVATTGALMLDGDLHDQIRTEADANSEAFKTLQKVLRDIKEKNNLKEAVYTFRQEGEELKFVVMTQEKTYIGSTYGIRKEMWPTINEGRPNHTGIFADAHGEWISAYAPIYDSRGNLSGILDVDIRLTDFRMELAKKVGPLLVVSVLILVIAIVMSFILSRRLVKDLRYLTDVTEKISTGLMERSIVVESKDEVGELAESLERMRTSLKLAMEMIEEKEEE